MSESRILVRLLRMYFPWNWEFGSALSKLRNFGGGLNTPNPPLGMPLLLTHLSNQNSNEQQGLQRVIFCKCMRICETKQGTMENGLFEWLCHTQKNSTAVGAQTMTVNAVKRALIL